jgi:hypothetical protein
MSNGYHSSGIGRGRAQPLIWKHVQEEGFLKCIKGKQVLLFHEQDIEVNISLGQLEKQQLLVVAFSANTILQEARHLSITTDVTDLPCIPTAKAGCFTALFR